MSIIKPLKIWKGMESLSVFLGSMPLSWEVIVQLYTLYPNLNTFHYLKALFCPDDSEECEPHSTFLLYNLIILTRILYEIFESTSNSHFLNHLKYSYWPIFKMGFCFRDQLMISFSVLTFMVFGS